ncbi:triacylglycerol lipase 1 [Pyrus ussuriensis x Pyrus communis]|uniref:Triacylglycerol lipase 1 n=1 Tax=Pyrus ussuriensis x Pyrus communis TaxID=2448454 RepID=A0A5N5F0F9_9ROSA|nr:triacylglycerol lipase 1 [Pyrus ussuriensis x Pyrus communis]
MGDAWFLNSPEEPLEFVLADQGFGVWELALFDPPEMMRCRYSTTSSEVFVAGHSQPDMAELVEAAARLYIICSEWGVNM